MRARILIVDDDPDFADIIKTTLESRGYCAMTCSTPADCERMIQEFDPGLLILDLMIGGRMEGALIARRLKGDASPCSGLPILLLTGVRQQTGFFWLGDPRRGNLLSGAQKAAKNQNARCGNFRQRASQV